MSDNQDEGTGFGKERRYQGLEELAEKGLGMTNNAIAAFGMKAAATFWGKFKRQLSTASEPLLRKNMGERYLSGEALGGGMMIWVVSTLAALYWPDLRSGGAMLINHLTSFHRLGQWMNNISPTIIVGGALVFFHFRFAMESMVIMEKYREEGTPYHTQSRGVPRWEGPLALMPLGIGAALFLFDLPACILFVASIGMSAKIAGEQQAAIYARYQDALDARIEQEYLEDAILGQCPTEITQLHKPLPQAMSADLRKNIAAAAVGKPVTLMIKGARTGGHTSATAQSSSTQGGGREGESSIRREESAASGDEKKEPDPAASAQQIHLSIPKIDPKIIKGAVMLLALAVLAGATVHFWPKFHKEQTVSEFPKPTSHPTASLTSPPRLSAAQAVEQPKPKPTPIKPPANTDSPPTLAMNTAPMAQPTIAATVTLPAEAPAPVTQPVAAAATADADAAAQAQAKLEEEKKQEAQRIQAQEEQRTKERNQVIEQIKTMLNSELAEVANFKTSCLTNFDNNTNRIVGVSLQARKALTQRNAEERRDALEELEKQQRVLARDQQTMQDLISNPNTDAKLFYNSVSTTIGKMRSNRQDMTARLKGLDSDIAKAPTKTPLFQIKLK